MSFSNIFFWCVLLPLLENDQAIYMTGNVTTIFYFHKKENSPLKFTTFFLISPELFFYFFKSYKVTKVWSQKKKLCSVTVQRHWKNENLRKVIEDRKCEKARFQEYEKLMQVGRLRVWAIWLWSPLSLSAWLVWLWSPLSLCLPGWCTRLPKLSP